VPHVESCLGPFGDSFGVGARYEHGLHQTYRRLRNYFGRTRWYSSVTRHKWKLDSVRSEIVLILMQDRCTACVEHITGSEIILDAPKNSKVTWVMWNLVSVYLEMVLVSVDDRCTVCTKCSIGSKIILNTPDGSPR
jgi:hypothetical protein